MKWNPSSCADPRAILLYPRNRRRFARRTRRFREARRARSYSQRPIESRICDQGTVVRDDAFLQQAKKDQHQPVEELIAVELAVLLHLRQQMAGTLNRPCDQMRKQADEQSVIDEGVRRPQLSFVDIDDVGDFLERIERDARRQQDAQ